MVTLLMKSFQPSAVSELQNLFSKIWFRSADGGSQVLYFPPLSAHGIQKFGVIFGPLHFVLEKLHGVD
jgi:hypothetical protein